MSQDLEMKVGANADFDMTTTTSSGTAVDISDATEIVFTVCDLEGNTEFTKKLSVGNTEIEITAGTSGTARVKLLPATTSSMAAGLYRYTYKVTLASKDSISHSGAFRLLIAPTGLCLIEDVKAYLGETTDDYDGILEDLVQRTSHQIERYCNRTFRSATYREFLDGRPDGYIEVRHPPITAVKRICVGRENALSLENNGSTITRAYATVNDETSLALSRWAGGTETATTLAFSSYTTITTLVAQIVSTANGWTATVLGNYGAYASTELIPVMGLNCADGEAYLEVPADPEGDFNMDATNGIIQVPHGSDGYRKVEVRYTGGYTTIPDAVRQAAVELVADTFNRRLRDGSLQAENLSGVHSWTAATLNDHTTQVHQLLGTYRRWTL